jgi:hypothetical protein
MLVTPPASRAEAEKSKRSVRERTIDLICKQARARQSEAAGGRVQAAVGTGQQTNRL